MDEIIDVLRKIDSKKIVIEQEMISGGCIAVPKITVTVSHLGEKYIACAIEIEDAFKDLLEQLEQE